MSTGKHGLGRGLDALFRNPPTTGGAPSDTNEASDVTHLPLAVLKACPNQPRRIFEDGPLQELADSIRSQGVVQPLLVRPLAGGTHYEIVAGERRFRAAKMAGLSDVPVVVRDMSDDEALTVALIENLQREDLNPLEEAEAMFMLRERLGESQEALAARLGKSRSAVANALRLLQLPEDMRQALAGNLFTPGHARAILAIPDEEVQRELYEATVARQLSVRDAESAVLHYKRTGELPASLRSGEGNAKPAGSRSPKPEMLRDVQSMLRQSVHPKVTVSGSSDMGRVTIPYDSPDALAALMRLLCTESAADAAENAAGEATSAASAHSPDPLSPPTSQIDRISENNSPADLDDFDSDPSDDDDLDSEIFHHENLAQ